ncbi:MAG: Xaa-Pro peptidase family protein [Acidimicrobiales bacterium]|nr:Xaa-Pro peptidase family protein [Acidimicrobiales bacterium]MDP6288146.1 Xaa-Pro peptidase family protein [Acidimicrobiales bacterium]MDP6911550.1 Xaa-Pro peptidase family protein [Acidimicrobiales bacterium]
MTEIALPERGFPESEFMARAARAQAMMAERGLDALLVCTEPEVRYLTGFHTPFWQSPTRPWFVILPAEGRPVAVIPGIGASAMAATWVTDIRTWPAPRPADDGLALLVDTLAELTGGVDGTSTRIGLPMGHETHVRMPLADLDQLRVRIAPAGFVDATDIVRGLRMVKSDREVAKVAHICDVVSGAFEGIGNLLSVGMTEREAFRAFRIDLLERGADDVPYLVGATGPGFDDIIKQPSDRVIEAGDLLMFDTGSVFDGYSSDFDRYVAFGRADEDAKRAYRTVWEATEAGLATAKPGATTSDLWRAMAEVLDAGGSLGNSVGRLGHGLGMQVTEWPSHTAEDGTVLEEGMVLTLEPGLTWASGRMMVHEENLVLRADGPEMLSRRAPAELPII